MTNFPPSHVHCPQPALRLSSRPQLFGDYYYFHHERVHRRSADPSLHHQRRLDEDGRVLEAIQQVARSRRKRDFLYSQRTFELNDPRWSQMWYLVSAPPGD